MLNYLEYLNAPGQLIATIILFVIVLQLVQGIKYLWTEIFAPKIFKIQTNKEKRKELDKIVLENQEELIKLRNDQEHYIEESRRDDAEIRKDVEALSSKIDKCLDMQLKTQIDSTRAKILDFAAGVYKRVYSKEFYDEIFSCYDDYEKLLKDNGLENGRVEASMDIIKKRYQWCIENNEFLEDQIDKINTEK